MYGLKVVYGCYARALMLQNNDSTDCPRAILMFKPWYSLILVFYGTSWSLIWCSFQNLLKCKSARRGFTRNINLQTFSYIIVMRFKVRKIYQIDRSRNNSISFSVYSSLSLIVSTFYFKDQMLTFLNVGNL